MVAGIGDRLVCRSRSASRDSFWRDWQAGYGLRADLSSYASYASLYVCENKKRTCDREQNMHKCVNEAAVAVLTLTVQKDDAP